MIKYSISFLHLWKIIKIMYSTESIWFNPMLILKSHYLEHKLLKSWINLNLYNKIKPNINKTYKKIKHHSKNLMMNFLIHNYNSNKNINFNKISSIKYNKKSNKSINKSKLQMIKSLKNKVKFKSKGWSKIFNISKKKIHIFRLKSNSINIKSKKSKSSIRKIKGFKQRETLSLWKKSKIKSKDKSK